MEGKHLSFSLDFIVIGCRKTGSTWLYENCRTHPSICVSDLVKESNFFSTKFELGINWYQALFEPKPGQICGEIDPSLITHALSAEQLHSVFRNIKIIVMLRDPADLFFSSYRVAKKDGDIKCSPEEAWDSVPTFKHEAMIFERLKPYLKRFDKSQFLFIHYHDLLNDPETFFAHICAFLDVDIHIDPSTLHSKVNVAADSRLPWLTIAIKRFTRILHKHSLYHIVNWGKSLGLKKLLFRAPVENTLRPALRSRIMNDLEDDIQHLANLISL